MFFFFFYKEWNYFMKDNSFMKRIRESFGLCYYPLNIYFFLYLCICNNFLCFCKKRNYFVPRFFFFLIKASLLFEYPFLMFVPVYNNFLCFCKKFEFLVFLRILDNSLWKNFMKNLLDPRYVIIHWISIFFLYFCI